MFEFILNNDEIITAQPAGSTVLDFVRYHKDLKGTKIGCREGDCGACTILVGELSGENVQYRTMTSCLMPLANAAGKHIVTVEGINPTDGSLTPVQQAMVDESGTQCGFCTVGFVMSLTGYCLDLSNAHATKGSDSAISDAISSIDGNICRCTGYKSIERAAARICDRMSGSQTKAAGPAVVPGYFDSIPKRLSRLTASIPVAETRPVGIVSPAFVGGGTDVYVQKPDAMADSASAHLFYDDGLRGIRDTGTLIEFGASVTVTDLLESPLMNEIFPDLYQHLKLISSTPIRNMATLAGNFVNASPIGDMTVWFLALDTEIELSTASSVRTESDSDRVLLLRDLYQGYKKLAKSDDEYITAIRFKKPTGDFRFNFEKVCKRTYLDIATVNTAISLRVSDPNASEGHSSTKQATDPASHVILEANVAAGGVAPIPLYLKETSAFLIGKEITNETITAANEIMQREISPISDVRGTEKYKRLLLRQLFAAHFYALFELS